MILTYNYNIDFWLLIYSNMRIVCKNFWCKGTFDVPDAEYEVNPVNECQKCRSFATELSAGVTFTENKEYPGERFDGKYHQMEINVKKFGEK